VARLGSDCFDLKQRVTTAIFLAALALATPAFAENPTATPAPPDTCDAGITAVATDAALMRIRGADTRAPFYDAPRACPATGACAWRREDFLLGGAVVLAQADRDGFRCVAYGIRDGDLVTGFVAADLFEPVAEEPPTPAFLAGRWRFRGRDEVIFTPARHALSARGEASRPGPDVDHTGRFAGPVQLRGEGFSVTDRACVVTGRRRGPYLALDDNGRCGGPAVRFQGLYARARDPGP
jgi:hypothetical protein